MNSQAIKIKKFISPDFGENTYFLIKSDTKSAVVIDPGSPNLLDYIKSESLNLLAILITHGHIDHITYTHELKKSTNARLYIHKNDENLYKNSGEIGRMFGIDDVVVPEIDLYLNDGDELNFDVMKLGVIHTPGHSLGSVCFLMQESLFTGDTLFRGGIGRTDLPGGDYNTLISSIKKKIFALSDRVQIYPGHGDETTIFDEKNDNPFL